MTKSHGIRRTTAAARGLLPLLAAAVTLGSAAPAARAVDGEWVEFLGWCPDSRCYAYSVVTLQTVRDRVQEKEEHRLVELRDRARPRVRRYPNAAALHRHARMAALVVADPAPVDYPDDTTIRFTLADGRVLIFSLTLDGRLGYRVTLTNGGEPVEVGAGRYDDLYAKTDAFAFLSPDGRRLALLVYGQNPWKVHGEVHYMALPDLPPRAAPAEPSAPPITLPPGEEPASEPVTLVPPEPGTAPVPDAVEPKPSERPRDDAAPP